MHHPAPTDGDGYQWPTCTACGRDLWADELDRVACRPCQNRTAQRIAELPALFRQLDTTAALMREARRPGGSGGSISRTPPIPPRLDVLTLVGPGGVAARLAAIEDAWRQALGWTVAPWRGSPAQAVPAHVEFLTNNLLWACSSYESVAQDIEEIRQLHGECKTLAAGDRRPGRVKIGHCPTLVDGHLCWTPLTATTTSHRVHCPTCGSRWETLGEWRELKAAQDRVLAELATTAA